MALYWAQNIASQTEDSSLADTFSTLAKQLSDNENAINEELLSVQGEAVNIDGYYSTNRDKTYAAMRPSNTLNSIIDEMIA